MTRADLERISELDRPWLADSATLRDNIVETWPDEAEAFLEALAKLARKEPK